RCVDVVQPERGRPLGGERDCYRRSRPAGAEQQRSSAGQDDTAAAERLDAPDAVEYVAAPAAGIAPQRIDRADDARLPAQLIGKVAGAQLVRNREYEPIQ